MFGIANELKTITFFVLLWFAHHVMLILGLSPLLGHVGVGKGHKQVA